MSELVIGTREELIARFEDIEQTYSTFYSAIFPELELNRQTFTPMTDVQLTAFAESLVADKQFVSQRLTAQKASFLTANTAKQTEVQTARTNAITKERNKWENVISDLDAQAQKRGMQKSAWYLARRAELIEERDESIFNCGREYDNKLSLLEEERLKESGVFDADIAVAQSAYTAAVQEKKNLLKKEQEELSRAVIEFNNEQAYKEVQYNLTAQQFIFERANEETVTRTSMMYDKLDACYAYLGNFTNAQAFILICTDDVFLNYLGSYGYQALYDRYQSLSEQ